MAPPSVKDRGSRTARVAWGVSTLAALIALCVALNTVRAAEGEAGVPAPKPAGEPALTNFYQALKATAESLRPFCVQAPKVAIALPETPSFLDGYTATLLACFLQGAGKDGGVVEAEVVQTELLNGRGPSDAATALPEAMRTRLAARLKAAGAREEAHRSPGGQLITGAEVGILFCLTESEGGRAIHAAAYALSDGRPLGETNGRFQLPEEVQALMAAQDGKLLDADREWLELLAHLLPACQPAAGEAQAKPAPKENGVGAGADLSLALAEARYFFERGRWAEAAARYVRFAEGRPTLCLAYAVLALQNSGGGEKALGLVGDALKQQPDSGPLYAIKGWLLLRRSAPDDALMLLEQARLSDVHREGYYWVARYLLALERAEKETAEKTLLKAAELMPADAYVQLKAASFYWRAAQLDKAVEFHRKAIRADPDDPALWRECGVALNASGRPDEAVEAFRQAVRLDPADPGAVRHLSGLLKARGQCKEALEILKKAAEARPDRVELMASGAETAAQMGLVEDAEESYRKVVALDPDFLPGKVGLAQMRARRRQYGEAQRTLEAVLKEHPDYQPARLALGQVFAAQGRTEQAVEVLRAAAHSPEFAAAAHIALARLHNGLGQYDEAVRNAQIAMTAHANAESSAVLTRAFVGLKDWEKAETAIKGALETFPRSCDVQIAAAELAAARENYERALQAAQKAIEANPYCREAFLLAGRLQLKLDKPEECVNSWLCALELDRWDAALNWDIAELLRTRLKDPTRAIEHYRRHVELKGEHAEEAQRILGEIQAAPQGK